MIQLSRCNVTVYVLHWRLAGSCLHKTRALVQRHKAAFKVAEETKLGKELQVHSRAVSVCKLGKGGGGGRQLGGGEG